MKMEIGGVKHGVGKPPEETSADSKSMDEQKQKESNSSGVKKARKSKTMPLYFWTATDVNDWLRKYGGGLHERYGELLLKQEVTGRTLIRMNEIKLEKIGITKVEHRKDLMQHILRLRLKHEKVDLKNLDQKGSGFELKLPDSKIKYQSTKDKDSRDKLDKPTPAPS